MCYERDERLSIQEAWSCPALQNPCCPSSPRPAHGLSRALISRSAHHSRRRRQRSRDLCRPSRVRQPPAAAPAGGAAGGAGEAGAGDPNVMAVGPGGISFDSLIQGGDTVTINVTINGINKGQIDFHVMEEGDGGLIPSPLHIEKFKGAGPHAIKAPAKYPRPIYLSALTDPEARAAEEDHGFGALAEPIKLDGTDVNVTINKGDKAPWMAKIAVPDQPPGDGEPALPPEEGDKGQTGGVPGAPLVEGKPPGEE